MALTYSLGLTCALGQCPVSDFTTPVGACLNETVVMANQSTGAIAYEWDFCSGDLALTPSATPVFTNSFLQKSRSFRLVKFGTQWVGFAIDQLNDKLLRFDFGNSPANVPTMTNLNNPGNALQNAFDFRMVFEDGEWYAFVANSGGHNLVRLNFGSDLLSMPTASNLGSYGLLNTPNGIFAAQENDLLTLFVSNGATSEVVRLEYGNAVSNPPVASVIAIPGSSGLRGIALVKECNTWFGLVTSYNSAQLFYLDFNSGLGQAPVVGDLGISMPAFPASISLPIEGGSYFAFVQSALGDLFRINFGASINDLTGTGENLTNLGISSDNFAMEWVNEGTNWFGFSIDNTNNRLMRITMPTSCSASPQIDSKVNPEVAYSVSGNQRIALRSFDNAGNFSLHSSTIAISSTPAPDVDFTTVNNCALNDVLFTAQNLSGGVVSYSWSFGDTGTSTSPNPGHSYPAGGIYNPRLTIASSNGCNNTVAKVLTIFNVPQADFTLPATSPVCTNQVYGLPNTSIFDPGSNPAWEWRINGSLISTQQELAHTFSSAVPQEIRLKAILPGCEHETTKTIATVLAGPTVAFNVNDACALASVGLNNTSSGVDAGYLWNFGDGTPTSSLAQPVHAYANPGVYQVALTGSNAAGCQNQTIHPITIYSVPQPDFSVGLPPFSCSNTATPFQNTTPSLTDSNITDWLWGFGDTSNSTSTAQSPTFTYTAGANYSVSLKATSDFGCFTTTTKVIAIGSSPVADFVMGPSCVNKPTLFNDVSSGGVQSRVWQIASGIFSTANPTYTFVTPGSYSASLTVTAPGGCTSMMTKPVNVPVAPSLVFTSVNPCAGQDAVFADGSEAVPDAVVGWNWNMDGNSVTGNPASFAFPTAGLFNVKMTTTHVSGCQYTASNNITIHPSPTAEFLATPDRGEPPLTVQFENQSSGASQYAWVFSGSTPSTSTQASPVYSFLDLGEYTAQLTATNSFGCEDVLSRAILVLVPSVDLQLTNFALSPDALTGRLKSTVTITNNSNIPVQSIEVALHLSEKAIVSETLVMGLDPGESSTQSLSFTFAPSEFDARYVCAEILSEKDGVQDNNKRCVAFSSEDYIFAPYPNPTSGLVRVDWITQQAGSTRITVYNSMGKREYEWETPSSVGLNQSVHDLSFMSAGMYFLTIQTSTTSQTLRFLRQ